jgi:hypothetical protein
MKRLCEKAAIALAIAAAGCSGDSEASKKEEATFRDRQNVTGPPPDAGPRTMGPPPGALNPPKGPDGKG